jgi:hypothetical protein
MHDHAASSVSLGAPEHHLSLLARAGGGFKAAERPLTAVKRALWRTWPDGYRAATGAWQNLRIGVDTAGAYLSTLSASDLAPQASRPTVVSGARPARKRMAVFAHFNRDSRVDPFVLDYLDELEAAGFGIIFVSASPLSDVPVRAQLERRCWRIIVRENVGHDFGSWREGLRLLPDVSALDALLLVNDSMYGPFASIQPLIESCTDDADVWSLTDSEDRGFHLQSYFLMFKQAALRHQAFSTFWDGLRFSRTRSWAVLGGELALSRHLANAGLRLKALAPFAAVRAHILEHWRADGIAAQPPQPNGVLGRAEILWLLERGTPLNPTHFLWDALVERFDLPFVKRGLIDVNPARVETVRGLASLYQRRFARRAAPAPAMRAAG